MDLETFRRQWIEEVQTKRVRTAEPSSSASIVHTVSSSAPRPPSRTSQPTTPTPSFNFGISESNATDLYDKQKADPSQNNKKNELLDQLIRDWDEVYNVPFFDIELPQELVVKVFHFLSVQELGRCACVSKAWRRASEAIGLWRVIAKRLRWDDITHWSLRHYEGNIEQYNEHEEVNWKNICRIRHGYELVMRRNWAERYCSVEVLEGRDIMNFSRQDVMRPSLSSTWFDGERVLAGYNDGSIQSWSAGEATVDDWNDTRGLSAAAAAVRIVLREQPMMVMPDMSEVQSDIPEGSYAMVNCVCAAGPCTFSAHLPMRPTWNNHGGEWEELDGSSRSLQTGAPFVGVWDSTTGTSTIMLPLPVHKMAKYQLSDDQDTAVVETLDAFDLCHIRFQGLCPSKDGGSLVGALSNGHVVLWDSTSHGVWQVADVVRVHETNLNCVQSFSSNSTSKWCVLTGSNVIAGGAKLLTVSPNEIKQQAAFPHIDQVACVDGNENIMVMGSFSVLTNDSKLWVFDTATANIISSFNEWQTPSCVSISGGNSNIIALGCKSVTNIYDRRSGQREMVLRGHTGLITSVQVDDHKVVSGGSDCQTRIYDFRKATRGSTVWVAEDMQPVRYVKFTDRLLVTGAFPMFPSAYNPTPIFRNCTGRLSVMDFSPAANSSRVNREFTSNFEVGPSASRRSVVMSAPYSEL